MAQKKKASKKKRTVSRDVVEKRLLVRKFNRLVEESMQAAPKTDGRRAKRRNRLIEELKKGKKGKPLKAFERVEHVHELLQLGETLTSLRKQGVKTLNVPWSEETLKAAEEIQAKYGFAPMAWRIVGLTFDGGKPAIVKRGGRPKGSGTKKAGSRKKRAAKKS